MKIGYDGKGNELEVYDICKFKINKKEYEGMIRYDEGEYAFIFEMLDNNFPAVLMNKVDFGSIEKIANVYSTKINYKQYEDYRKLINQ